MHIIPNVEEGGFLVFDIQGEKVALVTDTSCDLSDEQLARYDISMASLRVVASTGRIPRPDGRSTRKKCMTC